MIPEPLAVVACDLPEDLTFHVAARHYAHEGQETPITPSSRNSAASDKARTEKPSPEFPLPTADTAPMPSLGIVAPDPAEDLGQDRASVVVGMAAFAEFVLEIVALLLQSGDHRLVLEEPVALGIHDA